MINLNTTAGLTAATIKSIKLGEYFKRKPDSKQVYIRGEYDKSTRSYSCGKSEDISAGMYLKGSTEVYIGFTY